MWQEQEATVVKKESGPKAYVEHKSGGPEHRACPSVC